MSSFHSVHNIVDGGVLQAMWEELADKVGHGRQLDIGYTNHAYVKTLYRLNALSANIHRRTVYVLRLVVLSDIRISGAGSSLNVIRQPRPRRHKNSYDVMHRIPH